MRFLASILFALMTLILPTAGITRNFCTMTMDFVSEDGKCPLDAEDCCCKEGKQKPAQPDCMVAAKALPNADKAPTPQMPEVDGAWALIPAGIENFPPVAATIVSTNLVQRGPPVIPDPLYLTQRRLLI